MATTTREEWLASLKPGDQAATWHRYGGYSFHTVAKRTPSGRIVTTNGTQFDKNGDEMGSNDKWSRARLEEVTPAVLAEVKHSKLVHAVHAELAKISINTLGKETDARLEELLAVLTKHSEEK